MLKIYNSFTQTKEPFKPLQEGKVQMYVCGITAYDDCHLGHARTFVAFDVIVRYLKACGYQVTFVRNITDIDDKIIHRALENKEHWLSLTERYIERMREDCKALGTIPPTEEPRATEYIPHIIKLIQKLLEKNAAYLGENGDIYFSVDKFKSYGKLAHRDLEHLLAGARVDIEENKNNPLDFVLWKKAKPDEPSWPSPWGEGRPGWHIECSAMSLDCLGDTFDIHGGGGDLLFPHHENERAQSEGATGKKFVNTWMHIGFVQVNKEKMSKSLGNFFTIRAIMKEYHPEVIRYFLLAGHYRSPINFSKELLDNAHLALERLYTALRGLSGSTQITEKATGYKQKFLEAMDDDFNTPVALSVLFDAVRDLNSLKTEAYEDALALGSVIRECANILGIVQRPVEEYFKAHLAISPQEIEALIQVRNQARAQKNWAKADEAREALRQKGVVLEDTAEGTVWKTTHTGNS